MCEEEKARLILELRESALTVTQRKKASQAKWKEKGKLPSQADIKNESKCFFCKKKGHLKKDCVKYKKWLEKRGNLISYVCYESNMVDVNYNT